jgi:SAM-dependent MidA family methyltransferase
VSELASERNPTLSWRAATEQALYGGDGFYLRTRPAAHYRTSVSTSNRFAEALGQLLEGVDEALGRPDLLHVVDIGSGTGQLLTDLDRIHQAGRLRLTAVERGPRPDGLPEEITWTDRLPETVSGLVIANEWLDNVPVDVVELTEEGPRLVLVDPATGTERLGGPPDVADLAWLERWWPLAEVGDRAEVGRPRDEAWAGIVRRLTRGLAIAVDYAHHRDSRPASGTLTAYRDGRQVTAVPDGSCDITTHVALDSCADAGLQAGAKDSRLTTQREALRALDVLGRRPHIGMASTYPVGYVRELRRAGAEAELIDPAGLGGFGWLAQTVGIYLPVALAATMER